MNKKVFMIVVLFSALLLLGCGNKMPPDCSDERTKELVLNIVEDNFMWGPLKETYARSFKCSNGIMKGEASLKAPSPDSTFKKHEAELSLQYVRPEKVDKDIGKYTCNATVSVFLKSYYDTHIVETTKTTDVQYTSEFSDKTKHMSSAMKTGDWKTVSFKETRISSPSSGANTDMVNGQYRYNDDSFAGTVNAQLINDNKVKFKINTAIQGHTCEADGEALLNNNVAIFKSKEEPKCTISLKFERTKLTVGTEDCSYYCGMKASMDGEFNKISNTPNFKK